MQQLTPHFTREEFELDGAMPDDVVPSYLNQCQLTLEPMRSQFNEPWIVTSGYRSPEANQRAGGVSHSQHEATTEFCASDGRFESMAQNMRPVFDWVRTNPRLTWDQMILEHNPATGRDVIHFSWAVKCRRMALEGETNNLSAYTNHDVVPLEA